MSQIYPLVGVLFTSLNKCGCVPKWTNMIYGYFRVFIWRLCLPTFYLQNIQFESDPEFADEDSCSPNVKKCLSFSFLLGTSLFMSLIWSGIRTSLYSDFGFDAGPGPSWSMAIRMVDPFLPPMALLTLFWNQAVVWLTLTCLQIENLVRQAVPSRIYSSSWSNNIPGFIALLGFLRNRSWLIVIALLCCF